VRLFAKRIFILAIDLPTGFPSNFFYLKFLSHFSTQNEKKIRKSVEVLDYQIRDRFFGGKFHDDPFGASADGSGEMAKRNSGMTSW